MHASALRQRRRLRPRPLRGRDLAELRPDDERQGRRARLRGHALRQPLRPPRRQPLHHGARPAAHLRGRAPAAHVPRGRGLRHVGAPGDEQEPGAHARDDRLSRGAVEPRLHGRRGRRGQDGLHARGRQVPRRRGDQGRPQPRRRRAGRPERPRFLQRHLQLLRHEETPRVGFRRVAGRCRRREPGRRARARERDAVRGRRERGGGVWRRGLGLLAKRALAFRPRRADGFARERPGACRGGPEAGGGHGLLPGTRARDRRADGGELDGLLVEALPPGLAGRPRASADRRRSGRADRGAHRACGHPWSPQACARGEACP